MKRICITSLWMVTAYFLFGQKDTTDPLAAKDSFYNLSPVEVRAVRAAEHAPVTKTNISKKEIQKQNLGQDLPFLLNQTPSVVINSDAGNGVGYTGIRIRGTDASLSLIHISEPTRLLSISYAVFCLKKKKNKH